jgi:hypothetical protein
MITVDAIFVLGLWGIWKKDNEKIKKKKITVQKGQKK